MSIWIVGSGIVGTSVIYQPTSTSIMTPFDDSEE